jgi:uncharacterized protein (TIGR00725 family)
MAQKGAARIKIGVMGSARDLLDQNEKSRITALAARLGTVIAERDCILVTGATTGLPDMVSRVVKRLGGLTIGISPAASLREHVEHYMLPPDAAEVIIYTGFGLKGRNVVNIRASDIVIIFALNEFTIAYDEGKVIGVVEGSGGIADHIKQIVEAADKPTHSRLFFDSHPESLVDSCLAALKESG